MSGAPGERRILLPSAGIGDGAPWYLSSDTVVGCSVGESAFFGVAAALARSAATCEEAIAPPALPHEFSTYVSASAISWSESWVMAGITELNLMPLTITSPCRPF